MFDFSYKNSAAITESILTAKVNSFSDYIDHLKDVADEGEYTHPEGSINLPFDDEILARVEETAQQFKHGDLKYVVVIGIGGSNLGTKAIYDALRGTLDGYTDVYPKLLFLDTINPFLASQAIDILSRLESTDEFVINVISKSGTTTETVANFEVLTAALHEQFGDAVFDRIIATTDDSSRLLGVAEKSGITTLTIPRKVGGRYSVFSAVGLLPLALAGIDIGELRNGAQEMRDQCITHDREKNHALVSAALHHCCYQMGITINNNFFFNPELESLGKWYRQLMAESVGKQHDTKGNEVRAGITPIVSIGSTDLHSMAQLYFGGPKDKFTTIVYAHQPQTADLPAHPALPGLVDDIEGKSLHTIMQAIIGGVEEAYKGNKFPFLTIRLEGVTERSLGAYMQFKMIEMMILAQMMDVNAFDQPSVEDYKRVTRKLLKEDGK